MRRISSGWSAWNDRRNLSSPGDIAASEKGALGLKSTDKAYRVPTRTGSIAELNLITERPVKVDEVNNALRKAAATLPPKGALGRPCQFQRIRKYNKIGA